MIFLAVLNILLALFGVKRGFKHKSFIVFIWLIVFYYSITSLVSLLETSFPVAVKMTYTLNMTLCLIAFLLSDFIFNKKTKELVSFDPFKKISRTLIILEIVFWISIILTFIELRTQDYTQYINTSGQAGWAQAIFQTSSCIICYFIYKKKWWKLIVATLLVVGMVASTGVRSLIYFIMLPFLLYYLNSLMLNQSNPFKIIINSIPIFILVVLAVFVVNSLRFGEVRLPETELTTISLTVLEQGGYPLQYANSLMQYITRLFTPFFNALNVLGFHIVSPVSVLPPSIPRLNDLYMGGYHTGEAHMPATIFFDFYMSYGYYGAIWGFVVFSYIILICDFVQKNMASFFVFSSVISWHLYFLIRGSCDTCVGGVSYSLWLALILFVIINRKIKV